MRCIRMLAIVAMAALAGPLLAGSGDRPYDESANAPQAVQQALAMARDLHKQVLLVFGANWCPDCRDFDKALHGRSAALIGERYVLVKVDVGNWDRNQRLVKQYGDPIAKGIPAAVVLDGNGTVLYSTRAGELADARHLGEDGIYQFLMQMPVVAPK